MTAAIGESPLEAALRALAPPGVLIGHRRIAAGDEHALRPAEMSAFAGSVTSVRRASGAAKPNVTSAPSAHKSKNFARAGIATGANHTASATRIGAWMT